MSASDTSDTSYSQPNFWRCLYPENFFCIPVSTLEVHGLTCNIDFFRVLFQPGLIMSARWPATQPVDELVIKSSTYFMEVVHDLRKRLKAFTQSKKVSRFVTASYFMLFCIIFLFLLLFIQSFFGLYSFWLISSFIYSPYVQS